MGFWRLLVGVLLVPALATGQGQKVEVSGDRVSYSNDNVAVFDGNVVLTIGGTVIRADSLAVESREKSHHYTARGAPVRLDCADCGTAPLSATVGETLVYDGGSGIMNLAGGVDVCADADCRQGELQAQAGEWNRQTEVLRLTGAPQVTARWQPPDSTVAVEFEAAEVRYDFAAATIELQRNARVVRGDNVITGEVIRFNTQTGALSAEAGDGGGGGGGRVQGTFELGE